MVKINFNESALRHIAQQRTADHEGRLLYRTSKDSYRERWFRLCGNLLFYFRTNELGAVVMSDPVGVLVLAACRVQIEEYGDRPFVFSMSFSGEENRKHFFSGQTWQQCEQWVEALCRCGYNELRTQLTSLRHRVRELTGQDPLSEMLMIGKPLTSGLSQSTDTAAVFYTSSKLSSAASSATVATMPLNTGAIMPSRRAPGRPVHATQQLVQLVEPAAIDSAQVHTSTTKAATFSDWEKFE